MPDPWLRAAHASCLHLVPSVAHAWRWLDAAGLLQLLPGLGAVLCVTGQPEPDCNQITSHGIIVDNACAAVIGTCWLTAHAIITRDGAHEWLQCLGGNGRILLRLHRLPDTIATGWDVLVGPCRRTAWPCRVAAFQPLCARVGRFARREIAGLEILLLQPSALSCSAHSTAIARRYAQSERLPLR